MTIADNLNALKNRINEYEQIFKRERNSVFLLAASKGQSIEKIKTAISAGQFAFGENYVQEALKKMIALAHHPLEWHFIGHIQSNKAHKIAEHFAWVHSLDNEKIALKLNNHRPSDLPPINVCIEVNLNAEKNKSGVAPGEARTLLAFCQQLPRLRVRGLMAIPALQDNFCAQRSAFHELASLQTELIKQGFNLDTLSAGMSLDFEAAIAEGSTIVRLGTSLFGPREKNPISTFKP